MYGYFRIHYNFSLSFPNVKIIVPWKSASMTLLRKRHMHKKNALVTLIRIQFFMLEAPTMKTILVRENKKYLIHLMELLRSYIFLERKKIKVLFSLHAEKWMNESNTYNHLFVSFPLSCWLSHSLACWLILAVCTSSSPSHIFWYTSGVLFTREGSKKADEDNFFHYASFFAFCHLFS